MTDILESQHHGDVRGASQHGRPIEEACLGVVGVKGSLDVLELEVVSLTK